MDEEEVGRVEFEIVVYEYEKEVLGRSYKLRYSYPTIGGGYSFWLVNEEGEGMSLSNKNVFDLLDEYFKREF